MWYVEEPTHYLKRVGHEVPGVVAVLCVVCQVRLGWENARHISVVLLEA